MSEQGKIIKCKICSKEFVKNGKRICCSPECSEINKKNQIKKCNEIYAANPILKRKPEQLKKKRTKKGKLSLREIAKLAKDAGQTYGEYVSLHHL